ncbi:MAG: hypothetical protein ACPKPY_02175 [Nitrososphaeraceae archaeon]
MTSLELEDLPLYTQSAAIELIKANLVKIPLDKEKYLDKIRELKKTRPKNQMYYDYEHELDFSIDPDNLESIQTKLIDDRKYPYKVYFYQKLGLFQKKDIPPFKIHLSDLSAEVLAVLDSMDPDDAKYVVKQAVARIFEDINFKLYHDSLSSRLEVILV